MSTFRTLRKSEYVLGIYLCRHIENSKGFTNFQAALYICIYIYIYIYIRIIYDFIGTLNRITVLRLITESASDSLNEPYNINSALDIEIQNIVKTLLNSTVTKLAQNTRCFSFQYKTLLDKSMTCKLI